MKKNKKVIITLAVLAVVLLLFVLDVALNA